MAGHYRGWQRSTRGRRPRSSTHPAQSHRPEGTTPAEAADAPVPVVQEDQAAEAALYEATAAQVYGLARAILGDGVAAQDITAQVYRHAWRASIIANPPVEGAQAWLVTQAHRHAAEDVCAHHGTYTGQPHHFALFTPRSQLGLPIATVQFRIHTALRVLALAAGGNRDSMSCASQVT
jgi:hypothetical protein